MFREVFRRFANEYDISSEMQVLLFTCTDEQPIYSSGPISRRHNAGSPNSSSTIFAGAYYCVVRVGRDMLTL